MRLLRRIWEHYDRAGVGGVWKALEAKLRGRPVEVRVRPPGLSFAVTLRMRTSDLWTYDQIFREREYDVALPAAPTAIVDAGANIGLASVYFAHRFPDARIVALEPEPANFAMLERNVAPYPQVRPVRAALWRERGTVELTDPGGGAWGFQVRPVVTPGVSPGVAPALTVADVMDSFGLPAVDILKIDVEGAEKEIFDDASAWISRVDTVVAELHDHLAPGASLSFARATSAFPHRWTRGEHVVVARRDRRGGAP
jgi:FkbM family methyltransferase